MSGHNKFSKIKHLKAKTDAQKSKVFTKYVRLISMEVKKANGNLSSPALKAAIEKAREVNMPNDTIDRAVKKATEAGSAVMDSVVYETYGPGGVAIMIDALTDSRNRTSQEIKHLLSKNGYELAAQGSASWAFTKTHEGWTPNTTMPLEDADIEKLQALIEELENNDDVQEIYTNAE
ncbi:MAG: YebC/PmpR family DNA-binding transcriptional regulator [Candidatus Taylorbacteria bacterium]|nr:YebC/PmpR family DNA-binding transcriptional regulator [Candidatus Taylorbacteria bacterium]